MADTETFGLKLYFGDGGSPGSFTKMGQITSIPQLFGFDRGIIDTSEIEDEVKTFLAGPADPGEMNFDIKFDPNIASHDNTTGLLAIVRERGRREWVLEIPESTDPGSAKTYMTANAVLLRFTTQGEQDNVIRGSITLKISGFPSFASTAPAGLP